MPTASNIGANPALWDVAGGSLPPEIPFNPNIAPGLFYQAPVPNWVTTGDISAENQVPGVSYAYASGKPGTGMGFNLNTFLKDNKTVVYATVGVLAFLAVTSGGKRR